jgi:hypothetical protein
VLTTAASADQSNLQILATAATADTAASADQDNLLILATAASADQDNLLILSTHTTIWWKARKRKLL